MTSPLSSQSCLHSFLVASEVRSTNTIKVNASASASKIFQSPPWMTLAILSLLSMQIGDDFFATCTPK
jgi:hypothetical protein